MTLFQLSHCNVHSFIIALPYHAWFNFTKSTSASCTGRRSTIARRRVSGNRSTSRSAINSHKYKSRKSLEESRTGIRRSIRTRNEHKLEIELATKKTDVNKLGRRNSPTPHMKKRIYGWVHAQPNAYNNRTVSFDKRMRILISRTCNAGASHKRVTLCTGEIIGLTPSTRVSDAQAPERDSL
jgi:hypothetical protein